MDKKSVEKDYSADEEEEESKPLIQQVYSTIRSNWIAFAFALLICLITIIVVPIIYSLNTEIAPSNTTRTAWNITGITYINQSTPLNTVGNQLGNISSLKFDSQNNLYLLDNTKHRILKFNGELILIFGYLNGSNGSDQSSFNSPNDMFIESDKNFYIADTLNNRIQLWTLDSPQASTILGTGTSGPSSIPLNTPMSLTLDGQLNLYIADYGNNQIILLNKTTNAATVLIPYLNSDQNNLFVFTPISIRYSSLSNTLVIAQQMGFNVVRWSFSSQSWTLIAGSASSQLNGTSRTLFNALCNVDVDQYDFTYVVDCNNQRIQFYQGDLTPGRTIAGVIQANGSNQYIFNYPYAIAFDQNRDLYVADTSNQRIQLFKQLI